MSSSRARVGKTEPHESSPSLANFLDDACLMDLMPFLEDYPRNGQARIELHSHFASLFQTMEYRSRYAQHKLLMELKHRGQALKRTYYGSDDFEVKSSVAQEEKRIEPNYELGAELMK